MLYYQPGRGSVVFTIFVIVAIVLGVSCAGLAIRFL
jgi:hypothetical protein